MHKENGLSNSTLITVFSANVIGLKISVEWWDEAIYYVKYEYIM